MDFEGIFIKFGTVNNIKQLQKEGLVYCNTLKYFSTLKDFVQGDELETAWLIDNSKNSIFEITPLDSPARKPLNFKFSKLIGNRTDPFGNLFCLYALNSLKMEYGARWHIPSLLLSKYESYLIIKDVSSFLERLHKALDGLNLYWEHRLVEYKDFSNIMSEKTIFQKDVSYEYQKEFRLFIQNNKDESIQLVLDDISDISIMGLTKDWGQKYFVKSGIR